VSAAVKTAVSKWQGKGHPEHMIDRRPSRCLVKEKEGQAEMGEAQQCRRVVDSADFTRLRHATEERSPFFK